MIINLPYDNVEMMKSHHDKMKSWNENMAKQHQAAAEWHQQQVEELEKAMIQVPLNPEQKPAPSAGGASGETTGEGASAAPAPTQVPLDPVKKADLISILQDHAAEYGDFEKSIEDIANIILGE
jgi:hypothetical protein